MFIMLTNVDSSGNSFTSSNVARFLKEPVRSRAIESLSSPPPRQRSDSRSDGRSGVGARGVATGSASVFSRRCARGWPPTAESCRDRRDGRIAARACGTRRERRPRHRDGVRRALLHREGRPGGEHLVVRHAAAHATSVPPASLIVGIGAWLRLERRRSARAGRRDDLQDAMQHARDNGVPIRFSTRHPGIRTSRGAIRLHRSRGLVSRRRDGIQPDRWRDRVASRALHSGDSAPKIRRSGARPPWCARARRAARQRPRGYDVQFDGDGEILRSSLRATTGRRRVQLDSTATPHRVTSEWFEELPSPFVVQRSGKSSHARRSPSTTALIRRDAVHPRHAASRGACRRRSSSLVKKPKRISVCCGARSRRDMRSAITRSRN